MMTIRFVVNGVVAGFVVVAVSELARRYPRAADVILAVPLVVFAVYALMYLREPDLAPIARMARQMLVLVPLSLIFFVPVAFADRLHLTFWPAFATGLALVTASVGSYLWFTG
jgi:drug/metabolite transporter (DMT)-like permease